MVRVMKFGGSSLGSVEHLDRVADLVAKHAQRGQQLIVAVSAMGKRTDELLRLAYAVSPSPPRRELDMLLTAGERMTMALMCIGLERRGIPSVSLTGSQCGILTDEVHGNARIERIQGLRIREGLARGQVVVVAGFQGVNPQTRDVTTLGRGGTDLTAIALAVAMEAEVCEIYTDVAGVFSAHPAIVPQAACRRRLSWSSMAAMAWAGAQVMHPRAVTLAMKHRLGFIVRSSFAPELPGTTIEGDPGVEAAAVSGIAHQVGLVLARIEVRFADSGPTSLLTAAMAWLWENGSWAQVAHESREGTTVRLTVAIPREHVTGLVAHLGTEAAQAEIIETRDAATITVVGSGLWQDPQTLRRILSCFRDVPLLTESRDLSLTVCVRPQAVSESLGALHTALEECGALAEERAPSGALDYQANRPRIMAADSAL